MSNKVGKRWVMSYRTKKTIKDYLVDILGVVAVGVLLVLTLVLIVAL